MTGSDSGGGEIDKPLFVWEMLTKIYGHRFSTQFGDLPSDEWRMAIDRLSDHELRNGVRRFRSGNVPESAKHHPPPMTLFIEICRDHSWESSQWGKTKNKPLQIESPGIRTMTWQEAGAENRAQWQKALMEVVKETAAGLTPEGLNYRDNPEDFEHWRISRSLEFLEQMKNGIFGNPTHWAGSILPPDSSKAYINE